MAGRRKQTKATARKTGPDIVLAVAPGRAEGGVTRVAFSQVAAVDTHLN